MSDFELAKEKLKDTIDYYNKSMEMNFRLPLSWQVIFSHMMVEFVAEQTSKRPKRVIASCPECCDDIELSGKNLDKQWPVLKCAECGSDLTIHDLEY